MPVYLIINKLAQTQNGDVVLFNVEDELADMMAYEILYEYISRTSNVLSKERTKMKPDILDKIPFKCNKDGCYNEINTQLASMQKGLRTAAVQAYALSAEASAKVIEHLQKQTDLLKATNDIDKYRLVQSNSDVFTSFITSKTLVTP